MVILRLSKFGRKAFYSILTTFFIIIVVMVGVGILYYISNIMQLLKEQKNKEMEQKFSVSNLRDRFLFCYRDVVDVDKLISDPDCVNINQNQGISLRQLNSEECDEKLIVEMGDTSLSREDHFSVSIFNKEKNLVCLGDLAIYEAVIR